MVFAVVLGSAAGRGGINAPEVATAVAEGLRKAGLPEK
jgi:hypothetical protein